MALAETAALLADRTRAVFCLALLDGRAWTVTELARYAGVALPTASEHVSRLTAGGLLAEERQGRHRYVRLAGPEVATLIEDLASFPTPLGTGAGPDAGAEPDAPTRKPRTLRDSSRHAAEARARTCYDHLAGHLGVAVADALLAQGMVTDTDGLAITEAGHLWLADTAAISLPETSGRGTRSSARPLVRPCLDWTERRTHLGGVVGAAICRTALERGWVERFGSGRALRVTAPGHDAFRTLFHVEMEAEAEGTRGLEA